MKDPIERQDAIDEFWKLDIELRPSAIDAIINMLRQLPSTQTETPCYLGGPCEYQNKDIKLPPEQPTQTNTLNALEKLDCIRQAVKEWLRKWEGYIDKDTIARMQYRVCDIPFAQPEQQNARKFQGIIVEYPSISTYPEYEGKPYFSIKYTEDGQDFIGYGTYRPDVLSEYLKKYFIPSAQQELIEKAAYIRGFEHGRTQGMIDAQGGKK